MAAELQDEDKEVIRRWIQADLDAARIDRMRREQRNRFFWAAVYVFMAAIAIALAAGYAIKMRDKAHRLVAEGQQREERPDHEDAERHQRIYLFGFGVGALCGAGFIGGLILLGGAFVMVFNRDRRLLIKQADRLKELDSAPTDADDPDPQGL